MSTQPWHRLTIDQVAEQLGVDTAQGLTADEAARRLQQYGPNKLDEKPKEPGWKAFLRQYKDLMQIILLVAGLISLILLSDLRTFLLLTILTVFNGGWARWCGCCREGVRG